jgi:hypothetical protein
MQPSNATPDYIAGCEFPSVILPSPPCPIPDGDHCFGFIFSDTDLFDRREYVGTCLTSPLEAGITYKLTFSMGFLGDTDNQFVSRPFDLTVFGNIDCGSMPFDGVDCPTVSSSAEPWQNLGSVYVEGDFEWKQFTVEFTPDQNYAAVILGPPCSDQDAINYYFLDNLVLAQRDDFVRDLIYVESGSACEGDLVLAIPELENVEVQWYKDSIAIPGANEYSLPVEPGDEGRGSYMVVLSNNFGCIYSLTFPLDYEMPMVEINASVEGLCPGEEAEISSNYTSGQFQWSNGANTPNITVNSGGEYSLTYTNAFGCRDRDTVEILAYPTIQFHFEVVNESIPGASDGSVSVVFDEPVSNPVISWNGVTGGNILSGLSEGEYCVEIEADNQCLTQGCTTLIVDFYPLDVALEAEPVSCHGLTDGSVNMEIIGGEEPFQIDWSTNLVGSDPYNIENLPAGTYTVTVTDNAGTRVESSIEIMQPSPLVLELAKTDITCFEFGDGSIRVSELSGGNGDYDLTWLDNGTDVMERIFLEPGTYTLFVEDERGCSIEASESISQPDDLSFNWIKRDESCEGAVNGFIELTNIRGGRQPYAVNFNGEPVGNTYRFDDLRGNEQYTFAVSDSNGCTTVEIVSLNVESIFAVTLPPDTTILPGEEIMIEPSATDLIDQLEWYRNDGISVQCFTCTEISIKPEEPVEVTVYAWNEFGCTDFDVMQIDIRQPFKAYFPNAVSPNGDGVNDGFMIYNADKIEVIESLVIFNQWGQKVFERQDFRPEPDEILWDVTFNGEILDNDVLVIYANLSFIDGATQEYKGSLSIIR